MAKTVKIKDLIPDDKNFNKGSEFGNSLIEKSFRKFGAGRSILLDKNNRIIAGNKSVENAGAIGMENVIIVESDGTQIIAVKRTDIDLDSPIGREMALADNASAKANIVFDAELIQAELTEAVAVEWGIDMGKIEPEAEEDEFDGVAPKEPITVLGDLYEIGEHRLLCGDSTCSDTVAKLMDGQKADMVFTDPPYLMDFDGGMTTSKEGSWTKSFNASHGGIKNDKMDKSKESDFLDGINSNIQLFTKGAFYICFYRLKLGDYFASMDRTGLRTRTLITWNKGNHTMSNSDYWSKCEHIFYGWIDEHNWYGGNDYDIWDISRTQKNDLHPTMKPIPLCEKAISNSSKENNIVFDLFLGSGSTMVASEQLKRKCYGMELDPKYCDVIVSRMIKLNPELTIKLNGSLLSKDEVNKFIENTNA